ncbi:hypothetical protein QAD02_016441 [Eretmocerus hayati]|uniref:Uncharacterized protein n=1 Tax=Eretmocerus hayati TaxID=131215 RepID=A0ACC2PBI1_9HYME|nr:hypothetical protein QAD02_016441 [Eretmocerus hayati]
MLEVGSLECSGQSETYQDQDFKDVYYTGSIRKSATSTSELGLYFDYSDYYNTEKEGNTVRKFVIGTMVVVSVVLLVIFFYDFTSSASITSKVNQETKHIYILQNSLRRSSNAARRSSVTQPPTIYIVNGNHTDVLEDRSDDEQNLEYRDNTLENRTQDVNNGERESRALNLSNFKARSKMLDRQNEDSDLQGKQAINNHAMAHRMEQSKASETQSNYEIDNGGEGRQAPFRFEMKGPQPTSFKKYPQLNQYRQPYASRNIQEIIQYLTKDTGNLNRRIKFTGIYVSPKKFDSVPMDIGEVAMNSDKTEESESLPYTFPINADPLYQFKPKHPADVNLLATSNLRFSPLVPHRYNPYFDPYYQKPNPNKISIYNENLHDNHGSYATNYGKKSKPKPFSVMLDIYPITDAAEQTKKLPRPKSPSTVAPEDHDYRRQTAPFSSRYPKAYKAHNTHLTHALNVQAQQQRHRAPEEEEKHQMILHLNVYPKKKSKLSRPEVINRSEKLPETEKDQLVEKLMLPFNAIAKHLVDQTDMEETKSDGEEFTSSPIESYEENLSIESERRQDQDTSKIVNVESVDGNADSQNDCGTSCGSTGVTFGNNTEMISNFGNEDILSTVSSVNFQEQDSLEFKNIQNSEGFQRLADSLIAMD